MKSTLRLLQTTTSPHLAGKQTVAVIMRNVVWALIPACLVSIYVFGLSALITLLVATLTCVLTEHLLTKHQDKPSCIQDGSVVVTGILYALILPPGLPLWMVIVGAIIAVSLGKILFGGLGFNAFNPALVGRAFLQAAFPSAMTTWSPTMLDNRFSYLPESLFTVPFMTPVAASAYDGITTATPLALFKFEQVVTQTDDLFYGFTAGSYGETSALAILLGGVWLVARNMMNWRIPVTILLTVFLLSYGFQQLDASRYPGPELMLFSGGLMLGAVFMATDMVASPMTSRGVVVYGFIIGVLVVVIRFWGGLPEGVMYAILFANALSPHIDALTQPRVFGTKHMSTANGLFANKDKHDEGTS